MIYGYFLFKLKQKKTHLNWIAKRRKYKIKVATLCRLFNIKCNRFFFYFYYYYLCFHSLKYRKLIIYKALYYFVRINLFLTSSNNNKNNTNYVNK